MTEIKISFITERMIKGHGVDLVIDRLASGLSKKGYKCTVYCNQIDTEFQVQKDYEILKLPLINAKNIIELKNKVKKLKIIFNSKDIDIFIINTFPYFSLAGLLKNPVISINYGVISTKGLPLKRKLFYKYMNFTQNNFYFPKSKKVICISKYLYEKLPLRVKKKSTYVYLGSDHYRKLAKENNNQNNLKAKTAEFRKKMGVEEDDILLLYVGRLNPVNQPYKGVRELISLFKELRKSNNKIKLLMVGYGSKNDEIALRNEGILVISNAPFEVMPIIYSASDIYTTCTKWEGFDLPIVEAQSFGKPSVCYNICAHPEISIDSQTGFLVNSKEEFLKRVLELSSNKNLLKQMSQNCINFSKKFTWDKTVQKYDNIIKEVLAGNKIKDLGQKMELINNEPLNNLTKHYEKIPEISVLIINYNSSYECLKECIQSLKNQTYKDFKIIIADNNSQNDTIDLINLDKDVQNNTPPYIEIIKNKSNEGLGKAINKTLSEIKSKYVLISSFDVVYDINFLEDILSGFKDLDDKYIGLAPKIKFFYNKDYIESVGTYLDASLYDNYQGIGQLDLHQYDIPEDIFGVSFTSALIKTEAFGENKVGAVEENFFLFYEDFDFCYRANLFGYKFKSCPEAIVYHRYSYNFRDETTAFETKYYYKRLNLLKMMYKNCEEKTIKRLLPIELSIMKSNLKDKNLRKVSKRILNDFKKSKKLLLKQREIIQLQRLVSDDDIFKFCWGENNFFDVVRNEPKYDIKNLTRTYQRLYVITGSNKYLEYVDYLSNLEVTKFIFDSKILRQKLHNKLENEPISVHEFIDKL